MIGVYCVSAEGCFSKSVFCSIVVEALTLRVKTLEDTVANLQKDGAASVQKPSAPPAAAVNGAQKAGGDEDDDDIDNLFDDDDEDEEVDAEFERIRQERLKEYYAKKEKSEFWLYWAGLVNQILLN